MSQWSLPVVDADGLNWRLSLGIGMAIAIFLLILLIKLLLPWLMLLAGVGALGYGWHRHRRFQQRLYQCFYRCLEQHQGRFSALDFAIAAHVTGPQARSFLDLIKVQKWSFDACPTSPPAAPLLLKERLNDSLLSLLCKERLDEVLMAKHNSTFQLRRGLDARAKDFFADFEPTVYGDVLYTFRQTPTVSTPSSPVV